MKTALVKKLRKIINWLFPEDAVCIGCGKDLFVENKRYCLCDDCHKLITPITTRCLKCGRPTEYGEYCSICTKEKIYFERNYSCFAYDGLIRKIITAYKFNNKRYYAKYLASFYVDKIIEENISVDVLTAVPMTKSHQRERGYNQCDFIANEISERLLIPYVKEIYKKGDRTRQLGKSYSERKKNADNAYYTKSNVYEGLRVLVIDDIYTTGSTMNSMAKTLLKSGAKSVIGLTLCAVKARNSKEEGSFLNDILLDS